MWYNALSHKHYQNQITPCPSAVISKTLKNGWVSWKNRLRTDGCMRRGYTNFYQIFWEPWFRYIRTHVVFLRNMGMKNPSHRPGNRRRLFRYSNTRANTAGHRSSTGSSAPSLPTSLTAPGFPPHTITYFLHNPDSLLLILFRFFSFP